MWLENSTSVQPQNTKKPNQSTFAKSGQRNDNQKILFLYLLARKRMNTERVNGFLHHVRNGKIADILQCLNDDPSLITCRDNVIYLFSICYCFLFGIGE
jgi:hypothetical protein